MTLEIPLLFLAFFIYIQQRFAFSRYVYLCVYILFTVYFTHVRPFYGILAAIGFILYDNALTTYKEGFSETGEIPRVIYQTWVSKNLPPKMADCVDRLKKANPEFEYRLFDDADCRAFIRDNYEADVLTAYDTLTPGAFKADLWRYCVLYKGGGVYLDIKFQCEPGFSLKDITSKGENFYVREYNHKGSGLYPHILYTGVIATKPKNPVFYKCIRQIVENCHRRYYGPEHTAPTGPYLFASKSEPEDIESAIYAYYEENGIGFVRHIDKETVIMSHYPEYRAEQKRDNQSPYWKDAWFNRKMYKESVH